TADVSTPPPTATPPQGKPTPSVRRPRTPGGGFPRRALSARPDRSQFRPRPVHGVPRRPHSSQLPPPFAAGSDPFAVTTPASNCGDDPHPRRRRPADSDPHSDPALIERDSSMPRSLTVRHGVYVDSVALSQ